jgi:predicted GTPase
VRRVIIMGAAGRDFHDFNTVFRDSDTHRVVAFTATQIPGIDGRVYPASLAGPLHPDGIPIRPQEELEQLVADLDVDEVVLSYSDLAHTEVMHQASRVLATGADFRLLGPGATMLPSPRPVVAVTAARTGAGKSQTSRYIGQLLLEHGLRVAQVRHPMPYGDLEAMRVQRFATLEDIDASNPTIEEREEYEAPVRMGLLLYAGVDYGDILEQAAAEADVIIWDGGNNDLPFYRPDIHIVVVDPLRPGHELAYHPGETNLRMADVVVVNKVDSADRRDVDQVLTNIAAVNPTAVVIEAASPVELEDGPPLHDARVLIVEDGPTITHGGMPYGAGTVAARERGRPAHHRPAPPCRGVHRRHLPRLPRHRSRAPGHGVRRRADPGPGGHHPGQRLRRRDQWDAYRPWPTGRRRLPDPSRDLHPAGAGNAPPARRPGPPHPRVAVTGWRDMIVRR